MTKKWLSICPSAAAPKRTDHARPSQLVSSTLRKTARKFLPPFLWTFFPSSVQVPRRLMMMSLTCQNESNVLTTSCEQSSRTLSSSQELLSTLMKERGSAVTCVHISPGIRIYPRMLQKELTSFIHWCITSCRTNVPALPPGHARTADARQSASPSRCALPPRLSLCTPNPDTSTQTQDQ